MSIRPSGSTLHNLVFGVFHRAVVAVHVAASHAEGHALVGEVAFVDVINMHYRFPFFVTHLSPPSLLIPAVHVAVTCRGFFFLGQCLYARYLGLCRVDVVAPLLA